MHDSVDETPSLAACEYSRHDGTRSELSDILDYYGVLRKYAEHEDGLINSRLTWSLTIHGFLFTVYDLLVAKAADVTIELTKPHDKPQYVLIYAIALLIYLQLPVAFVGIVVTEELTTGWAP